MSNKGSGPLELTPGGIRELIDDLPGVAMDMDPMAASRAMVSIKPGVAPSPTPDGKAVGTRDIPVAKVVPADTKPALKLNRREWVKDLKARKKLLVKEIKRLNGLEDELGEINRLITAAAKPAPKNVRTIGSARSSG